MGRVVKACRAALFVCALAGAAPAAAGAQGCAGLGASVDDARKLLLRAANEPAFEAAKKEALRAKNALDDAAVSSMDCQCKGAYSEFDTAALRAQRARRRFAEHIHRLPRGGDPSIQQCDRRAEILRRSACSLGRFQLNPRSRCTSPSTA